MMPLVYNLPTANPTGKNKEKATDSWIPSNRSRYREKGEKKEEKEEEKIQTMEIVISAPTLTPPKREKKKKKKAVKWEYDIWTE